MPEKVRIGNLRHESNLIEFKPRKSIHKSITMPMIGSGGERDIPGSQLMLGFAYIDKPEDEIGMAPHIHPDRDQWIFLFGAQNFVEFDADVEFYLDDEWRKIDYPFYAYIPAGMSHEPLKILRVGKPLLSISDVTPYDVYTGRRTEIMQRRKEAKNRTFQVRRDYNRAVREQGNSL
jgi:hypothetical protein